MAKKGTYNGTFFGNFSSRLHGTPVRFGLLIGQQVEDQLGDVLFAAPTPRQLDEDGAPTTVAKDVATLLKSSTGDVSFSDWAVQHAAAVRKLLPAGLEPLGCFAVASEAAAKDLAPHLVPILRGFKEPLVLSIDPSSRKNTFWQFATGAKPALRPAQMKADSYKDHVLLWTAANVDVFVQEMFSPDAIDDMANHVTRAVAASLKSCTTTVQSENEGCPQVVNFQSEASLASVAPKDCHQLKVSFFRPGSVGQGEGSVRQKCLLTSSALLLRPNMELRHAVEKLREELAESAGERLRLALEESETPGGFLNLPWRSLFSPEDLQFPVWLGDYCMPDESRDAARERLGQLLGMQEESLEEAPKHLDEKGILDAKHCGTYGPVTLNTAESRKGDSKAKSSAVPFALTTCVALVVVVLAVAIPQFL